MRGYRRVDGTVGIRNHVVVMSVSDSSNSLARRIAGLVKGTVPITIAFGRGQLGQDQELTTRTLAGLGSNPNVAAVLLVGLEKEATKNAAGMIVGTNRPVFELAIQEAGGVLKATHAGVEWAANMVVETSKEERTPLEIGELVIGLQCGSSDTTSGISSNPCIGKAADLVIDNGGTVILAEATEWLGAELILSERARNSSLAARILDLVNDFENDILRRGIDIRGRQPSNDNIKGGLTTVEEKALGSVIKGGTQPIEDLIGYGDRPVKAGLNLMETTSRGVESITALSAAGSHLILFSTGQGINICSPLTPTIKICGNPATVKNMGEIIDVDVSEITLGKKTLEYGRNLILDALQRVASGMHTRGEVLGEGEITISRIDAYL